MHFNCSIIFCLLVFTGERVPLVKIIERACVAIDLKITSELKHQNPMTISSRFSPFAKKSIKK